MKIKLVDDARNWWRWHSMRFLVAGAALQGVAIAVANTAAAPLVSPWLLHAMANIGTLCMAGAAIGRVIKQEKPGDAP